MSEWPGRVVAEDKPAEDWPGRVVAPKRKAKRTTDPTDDRPDPVTAGPLANPTVTDGDTIEAGAARVRLWGVDAPELRQPGYDRQGNAVPIGEQSRDFLRGQIEQADAATVGQVAGTSYGRTVGPVSLDGQDAGKAAIRTGNALAAPEYLASDEQRRFDYMEAERLARLNGLGPMNDTAAQAPADYRRGAAPREEMARFWDTPTPFQGLRPEAEQEYLRLLDTAPAGEIAAFVESQGLGIDPDYLATWVADRDERKAKGQGYRVEARYEKTPLAMQQLGDGAVNAGVRAYGEGFVAGGLGELGAVADTLGGTSGRENVWNSDRRLADIWANNEYQNAAILRGDEFAHPTATTIGEIGGAITSGFVIPYGAGARTVPQLARVGAVYGGTEGFLGTDGTVPQRLQGAVIGAPVGAVVNAVGGKALEAAAPFAGRVVDAVRGKMTGLPSRPAVAAGEAGVEYGDNAARSAVAEAGAEQWPGRVVDERAIAMNAEPDASVSANLPRPTHLADPLSNPQRSAAAENVRPPDVLPMPSNSVDGVEEAAAIDAGRFAKATAPNERNSLTKTTIRNYMGQPVPKVGPLDLVGWLRTRGGLIDQGSELSTIGMTNAARKGMDFVGQEMRFGPLVNPDGMNLDDAALRAWEEGYFPELLDRPDIDTFLDAVRETYNDGPGRRFLAEDFAEIDAYQAMRRERYALELDQAETGGPIWADRSAPADDAPPFPPIEAYEEWPSDAIERVGNIDVTKLDAPQEIRRALKTSHNMLGGFDAATRGRITQAETERLAAELNMTPEALLSRRNGQALNAEEALAARQILSKSANELVNAAKRIQRLDDPGDELLAQFRQMLVRHNAIQEQVAGATAEAGRALAQFKVAASARAVRGDVLAALVRAGGGNDGLKDAAETLLDAVEMGPGKFNALASKAIKPRWRNKLSELYINMLLSNPPTHVVNMVSNSLTSMLQVPEYAAASAIGGARRAVMGERAKERILASEVGARAIGLLQGTKEGARLFAQALRTGEADDFVSKVEGDEFKAISGLKGEVIRIPTRLLTAEDQLFKGVARRMELNAQAVRIAHREGLRGTAATKRIGELVADPTDVMLERALDYGRYLTFQRKLGEFGQGLSKITGNNLLAKVIMPFVRTPINLLKFATERSPAAPLLKEWRTDVAAGGERRDLAIARAVLGTGFAAVMYEAALDGRITGAVPPDPAKAKLMYADGWQPYSVKIGDSWVSYSRLDPLSTTIGVAADMATLPQGLSDRQQDDAATLLVASIMGNLASKTWLSGVSSFVEGLSDPGRHAEGWMQRTAGAFTVPAGVAGVARVIDPVSRKRESIGDAIKARVPGMSSDLLPRRDAFGEVLVGDSLGPDFLSPFWQSQSKNDPVVAEMLRIEKGVSAPGKQFTEDGERLDYAPEVYDRYHEIAGRLTYNGLLGLIASADYSQMPDAAKRKAAQKVIAKARKAARGLLDDPDYPLPERGEAGTESTWPGEPASKEATEEWPGSPIASRDVKSDLERAIPGIRFTSGFRSPEYNRSLRARGYNPADNSEHLDGAALDMLPPPGKSLGWLRAQVKRYDPKARTLIHDGHLHAGFDDYYNAPALGGMAR